MLTDSSRSQQGFDKLLVAQGLTDQEIADALVGQPLEAKYCCMMAAAFGSDFRTKGEAARR